MARSYQLGNARRIFFDYGLEEIRIEEFTDNETWKLAETYRDSATWFSSDPAKMISDMANIGNDPDDLYGASQYFWNDLENVKDFFGKSG